MMFFSFYVQSLCVKNVYTLLNDQRILHCLFFNTKKIIIILSNAFDQIVSIEKTTNI